MRRLGIADVVRWTGGTLVTGGRSAECGGVSIDSRAVARGDLFIAIRGPRHDAHAFLADAVAAGATGLVVERAAALPSALAGCAVVAVDDTTRALGALAAGYRARFRGPVVAITGSNGKTTTKEMCAAILSVGAPCLKTEGNLNNQFGLPLTLLRLAPEHRSAVVEIGMNHPGEIAPLAAIAAPSVAVITNVGTAHVENLGSREAIAREKGALFEALTPEGVAVVNADDRLALAQLARTRARALRYGSAADAELRAEAVQSLGSGGVAFELATPAGKASVCVAGVGRVPVLNALAAAAGALAAGAALDQIAAGLASYRPPAGRLEPLALARDVIVLNDSYNANPQSMEVALRSLAELKGERRGLVVIGDMGELGATAREAHRAAGRLAAELGLDWVFALGEHASEVVAGALEGGLDRTRALSSRDADELTARILAVLADGDRILVKGSRAMRMERVVHALAAAEGTPLARDGAH